jgi:hypothetical protein
VADVGWLELDRGPVVGKHLSDHRVPADLPLVKFEVRLLVPEPTSRYAGTCADHERVESGRLRRSSTWSRM